MCVRFLCGGWSTRVPATDRLSAGDKRSSREGGPSSFRAGIAVQIVRCRAERRRLSGPADGGRAPFSGKRVYQDLRGNLSSISLSG